MTADERKQAREEFQDPDYCPNIETHTACPTDYLAWNDWVEKMTKTHDQSFCDTCGFYVLWTPKKAPNG